MATTLKGLCTPLQVFVVLAVISTIIYLINMFATVHLSDPVDPGHYLFKNNAVQYGYMALALKIFFYIIFGYLLQVLCKNKLDRVAWIILFLPYVLFGFIVFYAMSMGALAVVRGKTGLLSGSGFRVGSQTTLEKTEAAVQAAVLQAAGDAKQTTQHLLDVLEDKQNNAEGVYNTCRNDGATLNDCQANMFNNCMTTTQLDDTECRGIYLGDLLLEYDNSWRDSNLASFDTCMA